MEQSSLQAYAEQYFSSGSAINRRIIQDIESIRESYDNTWDHLNHRQQDQVINEHIITPEVAMQISSQEKSTSFPRLKITSGQKMIVVEGNTSEGGENKGYSYRDEHSEPFSWKTRSQQELNFDLWTNSRGSTPETGSSENLELVSSRRSTILTPDVGSAENLEIISARRSAILSCPFGQYSKLRREAKPVAIPVVPQLKKPIVKKMANVDKNLVKNINGDRKSDIVEDVDEIISLTSSVVVADSSNNIVLDFTMAGLEDSAQSNSLPASSTNITNGKETSSTSTFSSTLSSSFSFVKGKTSTLKKSLTPTLRRKKSTASTDTTCSVATECEFLSGGHSLSSTPTHDEVPRYSPSRAFLKPSHPPPPGSRPTAPPPPPPALVRPKPTPPLPPTRDPSTKISQTSLDGCQGSENIYQNQSEVFKINKPLVKVTQPLEENIQPDPEVAKVFSSEVSTSETSLLCSKENIMEGDGETSLSTVEKKEIAKTGFDFLDNW